MKMWAQLFLLEGPVATQLAAIRLPEIKIYPGQPDLDTHAHVRVHMCCTADSHSREHDCSSRPNKQTVTREAALLLSSTLGEWNVCVPFLRGSVISFLLTQQPAQELVQYLPQQEEGLQEQSQQHNVTVENHVLQILMPSQPGVSLPLDNTHMFTSTQHITVPVQLEAEQQLSSNYHGENPGGQEGRSHR